MFNAHSDHDKSSRILSEDERDTFYKVTSILRYGFIGAFLFLTIFAFLNLFGMGMITLYFGSVHVDPEAVWAVMGGLLGCIVGRIAVKHMPNARH